LFGLFFTAIWRGNLNGTTIAGRFFSNSCAVPNVYQSSLVRFAFDLGTRTEIKSTTRLPIIKRAGKYRKRSGTPKNTVNQGPWEQRRKIPGRRKSRKLSKDPYIWAPKIQSECTPHLGLATGKLSSEGPRCCFHWGQKSRMPKSIEIHENAEIPRNPRKC
jgi:hypothetical protein